MYKRQGTGNISLATLPVIAEVAKEQGVNPVSYTHLLALRITSLLDFLPFYDVDCQENGNLEYDTYSPVSYTHL